MLKQMKRCVVVPLALGGLLVLLLLLSTISSGASKAIKAESTAGDVRDDGSDITMVGIHNIKQYCDDDETSSLEELKDYEGCRKRRRILAAMETDELLKGKYATSMISFL